MGNKRFEELTQDNCHFKTQQRGSSVGCAKTPPTSDARSDTLTLSLSFVHTFSSIWFYYTRAAYTKTRYLPTYVGVYSSNRSIFHCLIYNHNLSHTYNHYQPFSLSQTLSFPLTINLSHTHNVNLHIFLTYKHSQSLSPISLILARVPILCCSSDNAIFCTILSGVTVRSFVLKCDGKGQNDADL